MIKQDLSLVGPLGFATQLFAFSFYLALTVGAMVGLMASDAGLDYTTYRRSVQMVANGANPYSQDGQDNFIYHPVWLLVMRIFNFVNYTQWAAFNVVIWGLITWVILKVVLRTGATESRRDTVLLWLLAFTFVPFWVTVLKGQINIVALLVIVLAYFYASQNWDILAGLLLALGISIKISPVVF